MTVVGFREQMAAFNDARFERYTHLVAAWPGGAVVDLVEPRMDDWGVITLGTWGGYDLQMVAMIGNERLVMTPRRHPAGGPGDGSWEFGWCYESLLAAGLALLGWDPAVEAEPAGYQRRAAPGCRQAGQVAR